MSGRPLRVLVAEDEPFNLRRLTRLLREAGCEVVAELEDGPSVLAWLARGEGVDALFLDIQMPGLSGLDVTADLPRPVPVVFVTAYAEHAVRAFEQAATDYLLKPVTADRLSATLQRLHAAAGNGLGRETAPHPTGPFRFPVRAGAGLVLVDLAKTTHFLFEDGAVWAFVGERLRTTWKTLAEAELALGARVVRGHRHLLIRPEAVLGVRAGDSGRLLVRLAGGVELEVSRGAAPALKARLGLA
ncbi:LytR/AlgR family response regulator transcription factor [Geothrix oryzisoli]|uniref:LytR/AlgR family response regulator transcription factor n=1 Tax=Geothrix oryzisoli TaxID=2922721 RepID=UPI001FADDF84|nr:LytTR family DNA-binding domain-containing protein [Geothrix oryzisoli]